jgi:hypothetical protein
MTLWPVPKKCHKEIMSRFSPIDNGDMRNSWDVDGLYGRDDPNTSMKILLDWWTTEGNYARYRGKNNNGKQKNEFAEELALKMRLET